MDVLTHEKQFLNTDLQETNARFKKLTESNAFKLYVRSFIESDHLFYLWALEQFSFAVISDDADDDSKDEPEFGTLLGTSFTRDHIKTWYDLVIQFLHTSSHKRCDVFWSQCPVPMEKFDYRILDAIEEIYNQRLIKDVAPLAYEGFSDCVNVRDLHRGEQTTVREMFHSLFGSAPSTGIESLQQLHSWLYTQDPLQQSTFNQFMMLWDHLLNTDPKTKALMDSYIRR